MPAYATDQGETGQRRQVVGTMVFIVLAIVVANLPTERQQQVASVLRATILRPFVAVQEGLGLARRRAAEAEQLRAQLDSVIVLAVGQMAFGEENRRLRGLLGLQGRVSARYVPASVVRPGTEGSRSIFVLDRGNDDGLELHGPVITRHGLAGVVIEVRRNNSIGMDWTHPDFAASAMDIHGATYGFVESLPGGFRESDRLVFGGTPFHTQLPQGTIIVTSGLGGIYPRGVPLGKIEGVAEEAEGWRKSYWLQPMVDPGSLTHVLVGVGSANADHSSVFPPEFVLTEHDLVRQLRAREDSLALLRGLLQSPTLTPDGPDAHRDGATGTGGAKGGG